MTSIIVEPDDDDCGNESGARMPVPLRFKLKPISERLDMPIDGECRVLDGRPYILYADLDYAEDWSGEYVREVHR